MTDRPYVLLSCAISIDGYLDDAGPKRLVLSNDEDLDRVDAERALSDAILVGASTVRRDDPRLLVRSPSRQRERRARGLRSSPIKVTLTGGGDLDPSGRFFTAGDVTKLVYCPTPLAAPLQKRLGGVATAVGAGDPLSLTEVLGDLHRRGVGRLMVEGGGDVHTQLLTAALADEIQLSIAPFFVGGGCAPRWLRDGAFPHHAGRPMRLAEVRRIGDLVYLRYLLDARGDG